MRNLIALCVGCLLSGIAFAAPDAGQGASYIDQNAVIDRFRELERMDVTAERKPADASQVEPISAELEAILEDAEALDAAN